MGRMLTNQEREDRVARAQTLKISAISSNSPLSPSALRNQLKHELDLYFSICAISRGKSSDSTLRKAANQAVFTTRVEIEKEVIRYASDWFRRSRQVDPLLGGNIFGCSKKQGTSIRFPLASCQPTKLCASACYAHDVLDAAPNSVIRGALNGALAEWYEELDASSRRSVLSHLERHAKIAARSALREMDHLPPNYKRPAYIRFAHVGDAAAYPAFANDLAKEISRLSSGKVQCVVYTRHRNAHLFDPDLFVVNFTLDASSMSRKAWIPPFARRVYSAFGGMVDEASDVNFLEHHRWHHAEAIGNGNICPATRPDAAEHTCDAVRCHKCFVKPL